MGGTWTFMVRAIYKVSGAVRRRPAKQRGVKHGASGNVAAENRAHERHEPDVVKTPPLEVAELHCLFTGDVYGMHVAAGSTQPSSGGNHMVAPCSSHVTGFPNDTE